MLSLLKDTFANWQQDKAPMLAASLAYYTIFSLAPILIISIGIANVFLANDNIQAEIITQAESSFGDEVAGTVDTLLEERSTDTSKPILATLIGFVLLIVGATGVFGQLQTALNTIWGVQPNPEKVGWLRMIWIRLRSLGMILVIGFILVVSVVASTFVTSLEELFGNNLLATEAFWQSINVAVMFGIITVLFAMIFKVLPDVIVRWRDVWLGAAFTALLFTVGKYLIGVYLAGSGVSSAYGAAGSFVVLLLWVYYSAQILLLGAEFTQAYAKRYGKGIEPAENAMLTARAKANLASENSLASENNASADASKKPASAATAPHIPDRGNASHQ